MHLSSVILGRSSTHVSFGVTVEGEEVRQEREGRRGVKKEAEELEQAWGESREEVRTLARKQVRLRSRVVMRCEGLLGRSDTLLRKAQRSAR